MNSWSELKWWNSETRQRVEKSLGFTDYIRSIQCNFQPRQDNVYRALKETPFHEVKCVIVGQDPYPTPGHATGLAFSVPPEIKTLPPTLKNIFKEYTSDLHCPWPKNGDLTDWARRGVLLWNSVLTVAPGAPGSHRGLGWEELTDEVLGSLDHHREGLVFILWGRESQKHLPKILPSVENKRHSVILSAHPSPLSARTGFFNSRPFSTCNSRLKHPIDWRLK